MYDESIDFYFVAGIGEYVLIKLKSGRVEFSVICVGEEERNNLGCMHGGS